MSKNPKGIRMSGKGPNALWFLFLVVGLGMLYLFWYNSVNRDVQAFSYTGLLKAIKSEQVESVEFQGQHAHGKLKNGKVFETYVIPSERLWENLEKQNVEVHIFPADKESWGGYLLLLLLLPFLVLLVLFYVRQSQNGNSGGGGAGKIFNVGKSKARLFQPNSINITFKDVAGVKEVKEDLQDIIEFLRSPEKFERLGAKIPRGVLLSGAPGTGKTMLAKAVAGEANCPFFSISGSDFVEVFVGVGASRVRDLFAQAKRHAPCIIFIDEIDAVGRQRGIGLGGGNDEREQTLNQLLAEMDGFGTEHGAVIVLAATNRPDVLDKALLRPGRFDRILEVPYPDLVSREEILIVHSKKVKMSPGIDLKKIARGTPGFTGADLENLINEAALLASKNNESSVSMNDFEWARDKVILGSERKTLTFTLKEKEMTAFHESGHTLLNLLLPETTDPFHKVSIVPRGRALGMSWSLPDREKHSQGKHEMKARIIVCFGGLIAEKLIFNDQTSGCANDIEQATRIARAMVCSFGMSSLGPIDFNDSEEHPYLGRDLQKPKKFSEDTSHRIDEEVEKIIGECYKEGERLLVQNRDRLELLAKTLVERETLQAKEVYELLGIQPRETQSFSGN